MQGIREYNDELNQFCESYLAPPSKPSARRTYRVTDVDDMSELSLRFMGLGTDRLVHTVDRSRGLTAATKKKGENISVVPPHNFPQGKWKSGKAPKVTKDKVKFLHKASIAEVVFTDTFETDDTQIDMDRLLWIIEADMETFNLLRHGRKLAGLLWNSVADISNH